MEHVAAGEIARSALVGTRFGDVRWVPETGSTNADALELARQGEGEGVVLVADHQTAGRGRLGRTWQAPVGGSLLCTILLRPPAPVAASTTMAVAVAAADAVAELTGCTARLKWPNDLVWPGDGSSPDRKLAGILAEVDWPAASQISSGWKEPGPRDHLVVAVGIFIIMTTWKAGRAALEQFVQSASLPMRIAANGNIAAWQEAIIGTEANGLRLTEVRVNVGDAVRKGDVLAVMVVVVDPSRHERGQAGARSACAWRDVACGGRLRRSGSRCRACGSKSTLVAVHRIEFCARGMPGTPWMRDGRVDWVQTIEPPPTPLAPMIPMSRKRRCQKKPCRPASGSHR